MSEILNPKEQELVDVAASAGMRIKFSDEESSVEKIHSQYDHARQQALALDNRILAPGDFGVDSWEELDTEIPKTFDEEGKVIATKEEIAAGMEVVFDNHSLIMLSYSFCIGQGMQVYEGKALKESFVKDMFKKLRKEGAVTNIRTNFYRDDAGKVVPTYSTALRNMSGIKTMVIEDTNLRLLQLRALHFITTRQDPDLREYCVRRIANDAGVAGYELGNPAPLK